MLAASAAKLEPLERRSLLKLNTPPSKGAAELPSRLLMPHPRDGDVEINVYGDPGAIGGKSCAPSSNGIARGGQSGPIYSGMPRGARGANHCRLLSSLPVFRQPVFSFLQSERKLGTGDARRNPRAARDDAEASMMSALADFLQSISLGLCEASDMLFL